MHRNKKVGIKAHKKRMEDKEADQSAMMVVIATYLIILAMCMCKLLMY